MDRRKRLIVFAVILFAVMLGVGISAVQSSGYRDVCSLSSIKRPDTVVVAGQLTPIGTRNAYVRVVAPGGQALLVSTPLSGLDYLVAKVVRGNLNLLAGDNEYAVFVLNGTSCKGAYAVALYSATEFQSKYGRSPVWEKEVVVQAKYYPGVYAEVYDAQGHLLYKGPVLLVEKILKGCHESYKETVATVG